MMPLNKLLLATRDRVQGKTSDPQTLSEVEEKEALGRIEQWKSLHLVRLVAGFLACNLSAAAVLLL